MIRRPFVDNRDVPEAISVADKILGAGGVVLLPTESFYGLGVDPHNEDGVARVCGMKGRPADMGLLVLCADWQQLESLVQVPDRFRVKLSRLWPASLTVVLPVLASLPAARAGTLAVRIPAHGLLRALLYRVGPLTGTSANRHGEQPVTTVVAALDSLIGEPDLILDAGPTAGGDPSTLVDLSPDEPVVLRAGAGAWHEAYPDG